MMLNKEGRFISRIFFAPLRVLGDADIGNIMAFVYRDQGEDFWRLYLRFRYYEDDLLGPESKDRRSIYEAACRPGEAIGEILPVMKAIFDAAGAGSFEEVIVESADQKVQYDRLREQPWIHLSEPRGN